MERLETVHIIPKRGATMNNVMVAVSVKRKVSKPQDGRAVPPTIPQMSLEKSRQISSRGRKLLIERYAAE